jgi:hypothetical protein
MFSTTTSRCTGSSTPNAPKRRPTCSSSAEV